MRDDAMLHTHTHNCRTIILRADETVELFISIASSFWVHSWCWYSWDTDFCCTNNARKKYYELNLEHRWILIKLIFKLCGVVNAKHVSHALSVAPQRVQLKQAIPINVWLCAVCCVLSVSVLRVFAWRSHTECAQFRCIWALQLIVQLNFHVHHNYMRRTEDYETPFPWPYNYN